MRALTAIFLSGAWAFTGACSALGGGGGGAENLPNRGIVPYARHAADASPDATEEPPTTWVLQSPDPAALRYVEPAPVQDGARLWLYAQRRDVAADTSSIVRAELVDGGERALEPTVVIEDAAAPAVVRIAAEWLLAWSAPDASRILIARSSDGATLTGEPVTAVAAIDPTTAVRSPSLVALSDGTLELYYEARDGEDAPPTIHRAISDGALDAFEPASPVFETGTGCTDPSGDDEPCWDADGVGEPSVALATTPASRTLRRLFYVGRSGSSTAVGFAASFDGTTWSRFPFNPSLDPKTALRQPAQANVDQRWLLYGAESRGRDTQGIALYINARPGAADVLLATP